MNATIISAVIPLTQLKTTRYVGAVKSGYTRCSGNLFILTQRGEIISR